MARTALTVQVLTGPYPSDLGLDDLTWEAADSGNGNSFPFTGKEVILARNDDASGSLITLQSIADPTNRTGNVTLTPATGDYAMFLASDLTGWMQSDGMFYLDAANVNVFFAIVRLK